MAKQDALFANGRLGNVIFYRRNGVGYARMLPREVRQTNATKQSAKDFGRAVKLSRCLRAVISPCLANYADREVMYTMNTALLDWLRQDLPIEENISFVGLELNKRTKFSSRFRKKPVVDFSKTGKLIITIPTLKIPNDIVAPSNTISIRLDIAAGGCIFSSFQDADQAVTSIEIPYQDGMVPETTKELEFNCKPGSINVVAMSLHYFINSNEEVEEIKEPKWTPVSIIGATMC